MPSGPIHDEQGDCSSRDASADFSQMRVDGFGVDGRQDQGSASAAGRANSTGRIGPDKAPAARRAGTASAPGPDPGQRALLANSCFILEPDCNRPAIGAPAGRFLGPGREVFLKASWASGSDCGCRGRTERWRQSSLRSSLPTLSFAQGDAGPGGNAVTQTGAAETHNAIAAGTGPLLNPECKLAQLRLAGRPLREPIQTFLIAAVNPAAERSSSAP
jgi:hypothetical protein